MKKLKFVVVFSMMLSFGFVYSQEMQGLPQNASEIVKKFAIQFDFDNDSCYPAPAISPSGSTNPGLEIEGGMTDNCRNLTQFKNANTFVRSRSVKANGHLYQVIMYALYFEKDQLGGIANFVYGDGSHRHDWEYASVWLKDGELTHATYSAHGNDGETKAISDLSENGVVNNHVKVVYHKHNVRTHAMRFAQDNEKAENGLDKWVTPKLVDFDRLLSEQRKLVGKDWGRANPPFIEANFYNEISKYRPKEYPSTLEEERRNTLSQGEILNPYNRLYSQNNKYFLEMRPNGNLNIYRSEDTKFMNRITDNSNNKDGAVATMQDDGNLTVKLNGKWQWSAFNKQSQLTKGSYLLMSDDGVAKIFAPDGTMVWQSNDKY